MSAQGTSPARRVAVQTLLRLEADPETLAAETLSFFALRERLSPDDLRLARTLVYGVLRRALILDHLYGRFLTRRGRGLGMGLRLMLRMGSYQHYYLERVPGYAIVNDSVEIGRQLLKLSQQEIGFLNAVLRKVAADQVLPEEVLPKGNRVNALAVRNSFPSETAGLLVEKYGGARAAEIMAACNMEPPLVIRTNRLRTTTDKLIEQLEAEGFDAAPGLLAPDAINVVPKVGVEQRVSLFETTAFHEGLFYAQDEGSQLVAHLALPWARGKVLDLCAAPGGKTTHLAELTHGQLQITATDISERRLLMINENIARLKSPGIKVSGLEDALADGPYDLVLVDAPCSGLGTARRNPELRYRINREGLLRHQQRQLAALESAAAVVHTGGAIIYSTCSVSREENADVLALFFRRNSQFQMVTDDNAWGNDIFINKLKTRTPGLYSTWPGYKDVDGFEAAVLIRHND